MGKWEEAAQMWKLLDPMGRAWNLNAYRLGQAEWRYAQVQFWQGQLTEEHLAHAEQCANAGKIKGRVIIRSLHGLRGAWHLSRDKWALAEKSLHTAVHMAREAGLLDEGSETQYALAKFHLGQLPEAAAEVARLAAFKNPSHKPLAELWLAIGNREEATAAALRAYEEAWADGEPYVYRYELNQATALLNRLGVPIPTLPAYDPALNQTFPWEPELRALIDMKKAENEEEARKAAASSGDSS